MAVSLRDFTRAIFVLYIITVIIVFSDIFQKGFTVKTLDLVKLGFFTVITIFAVILMSRLKD